jgi:hypothetical protein
MPLEPTGLRITTTEAPLNEWPEAGLRLRLRWPPAMLDEANRPKQRDVRAFTSAYTVVGQRSQWGESVAEGFAKTLIAAVRAGWVVESEPALPRALDDLIEKVDEMDPAYVRWMAEKVDLVYSLALAIPKG